MSIPTFDELIARYRMLIEDPQLTEFLESFETHFEGVASGKDRTLLTLQNAMLAAQTVLVVLEHTKQIVENERVSK